MLQGISLKKRGRGREGMIDMGRPSCFGERGPIALFLKGTFVPCRIHRGKWKMPGHTESAQTFQQFCPFRNQDFVCIPFPQMMLCTVSSGLGGLWTFYDPLLIKAAQPKTCFPSKCFFFIFLIYVSLRKCQTGLCFSQSKGAMSYKKEPISSKVWCA